MENQEGQRRADIEKAFTEGAAWGWDMAGIGFKTRPIPEIVWTAEGKPEIKYGRGPGVEAGAASQGRAAVASTRRDAADLVHRLEHEIRELEMEDGRDRFKIQPVGMSDSAARRTLIDKLKRQLRAVDPHSPYAR